LMLVEIIEGRYPAADPFHNCGIRGDGDGPYIAHWDADAIGAPQPTEQELLAQADDYLLHRAKRQAIAATDARSQELLMAGLEVESGITISTCIEAQISLSDLYLAVSAGLVSLRQGLSTVDGGEYTITDSDHLHAVALLWATRTKAVLDAGRALRLAVLAAES